MRFPFKNIGAVCVVTGGVLFLQGIDVLPGSIMTGQTKWAVFGGLSTVLGIGLIVYASTRASA